MYNQACGFANAQFPANSNFAAPNVNMNVGLPQNPVMNVSQNMALPFLSVPPPSVLGPQHVIPSSSAININSSPAFFPSNIVVRPPQPFINSSGTNVPDMKIFQNPSNMYSNNVQNFGNPAFAVNNAPPRAPVPFSRSGNSFNQIQNPNGVNRSPPTHFNPWSPPPSNANNFNNVSGNRIHNSSSFHSPNRNNVWSDSSKNMANSEISHNRSFPSKFNGSQSKASDINPWLNPPMSLAGASSNNYRNEETRVQSPPTPSGYNLNRNSAWNSPSNNFTSSNWKSGKFSSMKDNQNAPSFHHSGNSFKNFHNNKFQGRKNNNFKNKEDKAGNKPFACDTCDRAFAIEQDLKLHISEHIKCNAGNCDFEAHPKIVAVHKKMQHETGYAEAISKLKDAEEIKKWRAERKRRFPTAENVLKRKAEQAEKEARGEVIETKDFGKMKKPRMENRFNKRRDRRNRNYNNSNQHFRNERLLSAPRGTSNVSLDSGSDSDDDSHIKLRAFPGLTYLKENPEFLKPEVVIDNSDEIESMQNETDCQEISVPENNEEKGAASDDEVQIVIPVDKNISLVDVLSEKGDSDDEPPTEMSSKKCVEVELLENKEPDIQEINDDCEGGSPSKTPTADAPLNEISNSDKLPSKDKPSDNGRKFNRRFPERNRDRFSKRHNEGEQNPVRKSTLLEKLLADDIRHERNVVMQCIRYIVNNNFFDDKD